MLKRYLVYAASLLVFMFLLSACSAPPVEQTSIAVQVPTAINDAIAVGLTALVALGFAYLLKAIGLDLQAATAPVSIAISAWVVGELQNVINSVPEAYDPTFNFIFKIIVLLIAPVGLLALRTRQSADQRLL